MIEEKLNCSLWGKNVFFVIDYGCYFDEHIQQNQIESYNAFVKDFIVYDDKKNCTLLGKEIDKMKEEIIKYLNEKFDVQVNDKNIMTFIDPIKLTIIDNPDKSQVFLKFENAFDDEHGLAIEFIENKFSRVGTLDIALV